MEDLKEREEMLERIRIWLELYSCNYKKNEKCGKRICKYVNCGECKMTSNWNYARRTPINYIKYFINKRQERKYDIDKIINRIDITNVTENNILFFQIQMQLSEKNMKVLIERLEEQTKCKCVILPLGMQLTTNIEITHREAEELSEEQLQQIYTYINKKMSQELN